MENRYNMGKDKGLIGCEMVLGLPMGKKRCKQITD